MTTSASSPTMDLVPSDHRVATFINSLEARSQLLNKITSLYKTISSNYDSLHQTLRSESQALNSKYQSLSSESQQTLSSLYNQESSLPSLHSSAVSRIHDLRNSALSLIQGVDGKRITSYGFLEAVEMYSLAMNINGLLRYMISNRKECMGIKPEVLRVVFENCIDVFRFVLDGLEEFLETRESNKRWACAVLVQGMFESGGELGVKGVKGVAKSVVERGLKVLEKWRGKVEGQEMGASEVVMILQSVVVFGLVGKVDEEWLKKLVIAFSSRRDMAKVVVKLGFNDKLGDIIEELVKSGKEIDAVYFSAESGLTERFPLVELLRSFLRTSRKKATTILKNGNYGTAATDEANALELSSIRGIIKCVEDHKLESEFTLDVLKNRIPQLEKVKAERKKTGSSTTKSSNKRSHEHGRRNSSASNPRSSKAAKYSTLSPSYGHGNPPQSHLSLVGRYAAPHNYGSQNLYESPANAASHGAAYGSSYSPSPAALSRQYSYPSEDVGRYAAPYNYGSQNLYESPAAVASHGAAYGSRYSLRPATLSQQYSHSSEDVGIGGTGADGSYNT